MIKEKNQVLNRITKYLKELSRDEFNSQFIPSIESDHDYDVMIKWIEEKIKQVNSLPDSKKRFKIMKKFFQKLKMDNLFDPLTDNLYEDSYKIHKQVSDTSEKSLQEFRSIQLKKNRDSIIDALCKMYAHAYERTCKLYFKPLAKRIANKKRISCGSSIQTIINYYPAVDFVLKPFINHIRNSIDHIDYHFDNKKNLLVFDDEDKPSIELTMSRLENMCKLQVVSDVCIGAALDSLKMPMYKMVQGISQKTQKYCNILGIDYDTLSNKFVSKGIPLIQVCNAMEKIVKEN